jgi:methylphosphotriester-DNA--protein-cysteine methyltransferase
MIRDTDITRTELKKMILSSEVKFGGNAKLKIYGTLDCASGKRMKRQNRVFFSTEQDALTAGYRPCGYCLREKYLKWMSKDQVEIS